jgi:thioredoxin 2
MSHDARGATVPCPFCSTLNRVRLDRVADRPKCGQCSRPLLLDRPVRVSDQDLPRVLTGTDVPLLVDFWAEWCAPCKIMAPILDDIARDRAGSLLVGKLDTDHNPAMARKYSIGGIPTLILFRDGREIGRQTGALPRQRLEEWLVASAS